MRSAEGFKKYQIFACSLTYNEPARVSLINCPSYPTFPYLVAFIKETISKHIEHDAFGINIVDTGFILGL